MRKYSHGYVEQQELSKIRTLLNTTINNEHKILKIQTSERRHKQQSKWIPTEYKQQVGEVIPNTAQFTDLAENVYLFKCSKL